MAGAGLAAKFGGPGGGGLCAGTGGFGFGFGLGGELLGRFHLFGGHSRASCLTAVPALR